MCVCMCVCVCVCVRARCAEGVDGERSGSGTEGESAAATALGVRLEPRFVGVLPSDLQTPPAPNKANIWELAWHPLAPHHQLAASFTVRPNPNLSPNPNPNYRVWALVLRPSCVCVCMRDVKEVHTTVCGHCPSAFLSGASGVLAGALGHVDVTPCIHWL